MKQAILIQIKKFGQLGISGSFIVLLIVTLLIELLAFYTAASFRPISLWVIGSQHQSEVLVFVITWGWLLIFALLGFAWQWIEKRIAVLEKASPSEPSKAKTPRNDSPAYFAIVVAMLLCIGLHVFHIGRTFSHFAIVGEGGAVILEDGKENKEFNQGLRGAGLLGFGFEYPDANKRNGAHWWINTAREEKITPDTKVRVAASAIRFQPLCIALSGLAISISMLWVIIRGLRLWDGLGISAVQWERLFTWLKENYREIRVVVPVFVIVFTIARLWTPPEDPNANFWEIFKVGMLGALLFWGIRRLLLAGLSSVDGVGDKSNQLDGQKIIFSLPHRRRARFHRLIAATALAGILCVAYAVHKGIKNASEELSPEFQDIKAQKDELNAAIASVEKSISSEDEQKAQNQARYGLLKKQLEENEQKIKNQQGFREPDIDLIDRNKQILSEINLVSPDRKMAWEEKLKVLEARKDHLSGIFAKHLEFKATPTPQSVLMMYLPRLGILVIGFYIIKMITVIYRYNIHSADSQDSIADEAELLYAMFGDMKSLENPADKPNKVDAIFGSYMARLHVPRPAQDPLPKLSVGSIFKATKPSADKKESDG